MRQRSIHPIFRGVGSVSPSNETMRSREEALVVDVLHHGRGSSERLQVRL